MKVAVVFIGTNKYIDFLPKYYENIEKYFLPNSEKTFLVFTDGELNETPDNVRVYHQEHLAWPYITLKRFEIINKARQVIEEHDWLVFLDADTLVVDTVTEEEFSQRCCNMSTDEAPFFGVHHPCHFWKMEPHNKPPGAYEQNPKSRAYVDTSEEEYGRWDGSQPYFQGCYWGGKVPYVCAMIDELEARVNEDLENGIVAVWHDESHLNKYYRENEFKVYPFHPQFAWPEVFKDHELCDFDPKIVHLAKDNSEYQQ